MADPQALVKVGPGADLRGADLRGASLLNADLRDVNLRDADLSNADLIGAIANQATTWPSGFDPVAARVEVE